MNPGWPDLLLSFPSEPYHGLYIEFKRPKTDTRPAGKVSTKQVVRFEKLRNAGYVVAVCYTWDEARKVFYAYLLKTDV